MANESFKTIIDKSVKGSAEDGGQAPDYSFDKYIGQMMRAKRTVLDKISVPKDSVGVKSRKKAAREMMEDSNSDAAMSLIQQFYDLYMSSDCPNADISYRLGDVVEELPAFSFNPDTNETEGVVTGETTAKGRLFTASNFYHTFEVMGYSPAMPNGHSTYNEYYVNLFFPPYFGTNPAIAEPVIDVSRKQVSEYTDPTTGSKVKEITGVSWPEDACKLDMNTDLNRRGKFTYRQPGFKSLNDNISMMQWLFEKVSGIVSTYMTEWDLSQYFQESLLSASNGAYPKWISLVHRVGDDGVCSGRNSAESMTFGVVNAAVSKLYGTNSLKWFPGEYPLSTFWTSYPEWKGNTNSDLRRFFEDGIRGVYYPAFYDLGTTDPDNCNTIISKLQRDDFQGQALSGFSSWVLKYFEAFYTTPEDKLSDVDIIHMDVSSGPIDTKDVIDMVKENVFGFDPNTASARNRDCQGQQNDYDQKEVDALLAGQKADSLGEDETAKNFATLAKFGTAMSRLTDDALKAFDPVAASSQRMSSVRAATPMTQVDETGDNWEATEPLGSSNEFKDSAVSIGINQRAPAIFGGPHGMYRSPFSVQSYEEPANPFLRDCPRVYIPISEKKDEPWQLDLQLNHTKALHPTEVEAHQELWTPQNPYFPGPEQWSTSAVGADWSKNNPSAGDTSYSAGLNALKAGRMYYTWQKAYYYTDVAHTIAGTRHIHGGGSWHWWFWYRWEPYWQSYSWPQYYNGRHVEYRLPEYTYSRLPSKWRTFWTSSGWPYSRYEYGLNVGRGRYRYMSGRESYIYWNWCRRPSWYYWHYRWNYGGSHPRYCWCYCRLQWDWYGLHTDMLLPCRTGWTKERHVKPYKKYIQDCNPYQEWAINATRTGDVHISCNWGSGWWGRWCRWWGRLFGYRTTYSCSVRNVRDCYKLWFPGGSKNSSASKSIVQFDRGGDGHVIRTDEILHTWEENDILKHMINYSGGRYAKTPVFFLAGNDSYSDRVNNGPKHIFRCYCHQQDYQYVWYEQVVRTKSCSYDWWYEYIPHVEWDYYIEVDLNHCVEFYADCNLKDDNVVNNINLSGDKLITDCRVSDYNYGYGNANDPQAILLAQSPWTTSYYLGDSLHSAPVGTHGFGIMSMFQGFNTHVEYDEFGDFTNLTMPDGTFDKSFITLPFSYYEGQGSASSYYHINGIDYYFSQGRQTYKQIEMDPALKRCWLNACLRCTWYTVDSYYRDRRTLNNEYDLVEKPKIYHVPMDYAFRLFYGQVLYQLSYFKAVKGFFCTDLFGNSGQKAFDFKLMGNMIRGEIPGQGIVSNKVMTFSKDPAKYKSKLGYNQWITKALEWFPTAKEDTEENRQLADAKQKELELAIQSRIDVFEQAAKVLQPLVAKEIKEWSYNEILNAKSEMAKVLNNVQTEKIEDFFCSYLNCLYEYRKYFIDKRFNKQDGSMWMCRSLESMVPMLIAKSMDNGATPGTVDMGEYDVAFYEINNSIGDKVAASNNGTTLTDRVQRVYVKVDYASKAAYEADVKRRQGPGGKMLEPKIIKVKKWEWEKNEYGELVWKNHPKPTKKSSPIIKYAYKPIDGKYQLISKEWKKNKANIVYNESIQKGAPRKFVNPDIKDAIWDIKWGIPEAISQEEVGETPIVFDVFKGLDTVKSKELIAKGIENPQELMCAAKVSYDYWQIDVGQTPLPDVVGYQNDMKLVRANDPNVDQKDLKNVTINGVFFQSLYPIVAEQGDMIAILGLPTDKLL